MSTAPCPVCDRRIPLADIQRHTNQCLDAQSAAPPPPPPGSAVRVREALSVLRHAATRAASDDSSGGEELAEPPAGGARASASIRADPGASASSALSARRSDAPAEVTGAEVQELIDNLVVPRISDFAPRGSPAASSPSAAALRAAADAGSGARSDADGSDEGRRWSSPEVHFRRDGARRP